MGGYLDLPVFPVNTLNRFFDRDSGNASWVSYPFAITVFCIWEQARSPSRAFASVCEERRVNDAAARRCAASQRSYRQRREAAKAGGATLPSEAMIRLSFLG